MTDEDTKNSEKTNVTRCFVALEMPREVITYIEEIQNLIKKKNLFYGKFTEPENLHLTLKFLGEIDEKKLEEAKTKLGEIKLSGFEANLGEIGVFSKKFLKIVWIKLNGKGIFELQKLIDNALKDIGFESEERFMSHITIARIKKVGDKTSFLEYLKNIKLRKIKFNVSEFFLKKSELHEEGPVYENIKQYPLFSSEKCT